MFIIHSLDKVGGAETILTRLANYFSSHLQHEVMLLSLSDHKINFKIDDKVNIINKNIIKNLDNITKQIKYIKKTINETNPDIIISFVTGINIISIIAAKLTSTPIIISERSNYEYGVKNRLWSFLRRVTYPYANVLVLPTSEEKYKYHYSKQISIIRNPLNYEKNNSPIERENIILAVGSLKEVKGFDMLIDSFNNLSENNWRLIILGEGEIREKLETQIKKLNLKKKVFLPGHTKDTSSYYKKASLFILSSRSEGYPNVLCEAMSYSCTPIAFNCPTGPKDIIEHQKNGILVEAENTRKLTEEIEKLMEDSELRVKLGEEASNISNNLHINRISKEWEELAKNTIKNFKGNS